MQANSPDVIEADDPVSGLPVIPTPYGAFGSYAFAGATQDVGFEEFPIGLQVFAPMSDGYPGVGGGGDCMASPSTSPFTPTPYNQVPNAYQALKAETPGTNNQGFVRAVLYAILVGAETNVTLSSGPRCTPRRIMPQAFGTQAWATTQTS